MVDAVKLPLTAQQEIGIPKYFADFWGAGLIKVLRAITPYKVTVVWDDHSELCLFDLTSLTANLSFCQPIRNG